MDILKREYLNKLIAVMGTPDIKVITGIRRSGKSILLEEFKSYIEINTQNYNIIHINFDLPEYDHLLEKHALYNYIESQYKVDKENYVLINEVSMVDGAVEAINWLHATENYDIYITASNDFLQSSKMATLLTGRTFGIRIFPFSYKEYLEYYGYSNTDDTFDKYTLEGGFSGSYVYNTLDKKYDYISEVFKTLIVRDIVQRNNIKNVSLMDSISDFLVDNISNIVSVNTIANVLSANNVSTNDKTVGSYIKYLCESFAFYRIRRYDIKGKKYLASNDKYYLCDHSIKYALQGIKNMDYGRTYQNMVAIELLRRGYEVYIGVLYNKEIDFVAMKRNEKLYIQVSDNISDEDTFNREVASLLSIKDAYPKMVIARTHHAMYTYEGIQIIDIKDWLNSK